jgi:hypothetical protein
MLEKKRPWKDSLENKIAAEITSYKSYYIIVSYMVWIKLRDAHCFYFAACRRERWHAVPKGSRDLRTEA